MKDKLIIIGAGGHGKVAADVALSMGCYREIEYIDDNYEHNKCYGYPVIGDCSVIDKYTDGAQFFVAIGNSKTRQEKMELLERSGAEIATLVHSSAVIGKDVTLGKGTIVMPGTVINAEAEIGEGVIINTGSTIDHECNIDEYTHISVGANIAGQVVIGKHSMIGAGSVIINNISICDECIIGAGAVVIKDISESGTYIGVPTIKHR